jgi:hypothetical protein
VTSLRAKEFFDKLSEFADKGKVSKEQVEVMRHSNNVVYGFAVGSEIYLNENNINAHTPAHEFTHIWAKVVRDMKPKLWKQGVKLLKSDKEAKAIWDEVMNDQNYANIHNNEDAVASEVLSRIVGGNNEKLIQAIFEGKRPTHNKSFGKRLLAWIEKFFGEVVDIFGLDRDVDYKEFVNAPLGAIWDEKAGRSFNALLKQWKKKQNIVDNAEFNTQEITPEDEAYFAAIERGDMETVQRMVSDKARENGYDDTIPEQTGAFVLRTKPSPKKTVKAYKVFTLADDGSPTALFVAGNVKLPQGVWLDAVDTWHFTADNGLKYIPSTKNPYSSGKNTTGKSIKIPSEETRQELIARGYLSAKSKAQNITGLAYRPGWHAGDLPFFPQGGKAGNPRMLPSGRKNTKFNPDMPETNYLHVHRKDQVVFECELAAENDYTKFSTQTNGKVKYVDMQKMPTDSFYRYATNPMTSANALGTWYISGSLKIGRALSQEECDKILADKGFLPQEWEQGELDLKSLGYTGEQNDAARKTLAPITYDEDGNIIPLSKRFDKNNPSIFYQSVRGQTKVSGMTRVVSLFESADKSTFVHELGHVALADLKMLAEMENAPEQLVKDWQVVKDWLGCKDGNLTREHHEQFAKGFEAYLRSGEAPVRGLKAVFRKFKKWLCDIYADFTQLGGKPSPEVKAVMARMLASEQEIEAEAKLQGIESITSKKEMQILDESTQAMYERWVTEAKEEAKEKVLKVAMKAVTDRMEEGRQEIIKTMREDIENDLKQRDIFKAEALVKLSGGKDILPTLGYTEERYQAELDEYGGSLEVAVERELAKAVEDMDGYTEMEGVIEAEAKKALQSSEYKAMLLTLEYEAMARKEAEESRLDKSIDKALDAIEKELRGDKPEKEDSKEVKSLKQRIADLKYTYRWREAEMKFIEQLQRAESNEAKQTAVKKLKEEIDKSKKGIRLVRDAIEGQSDSYRKAASKRLAEMPIAQATATASWVHKERMKGSEANRLMAKGKWEEAKKAKQEQLMFSYFAAESAKIKANVEKVVRQLKKRSDSVAKGTVQMAADERYFYNHLLYVFGINRRDAIKPIEWDDNSSVNAIFKRYADNNEVYFVNEAGEYEVPSFIISAARSGDVYQSQVDTGRKKPKNALGYGALTKEDFDCLADLLSSVYTIGKNAKKLLTVKDAEGNSVDLNDAVMAICNDIMQNVKAKDDNDPTGATKKEWYEAIVEKGSNLFGELVKPETLFRRNDGGKEGHSMQFLYNPLKHAADKQLVMQAEATKAMKAIFDKYSKKGWHKKQYAFGTSLLDKEQLIVVALNWGTEINRRRIRDGYGVTTSQVDEALSHLTTEDWRLVNSLWDLIGSYWEETVAVEERLTGVGLEKQQALPFTINGKDGNIHHISGGYYPIMYDPAKSARSAEQAVDDIAKQKMSGNMVYGTHRGFTKKRTTAKVERMVYLTLEPLSKALDDVIHNICYREAVRDVNKIINSKDFEVVMVDAYGLPVYMGLKKWIRDNWAMDEHKDGFAKFAGMLRRNMTMAVMGYRVTTALLNVLNIFPMAEYIGAGRAISAVVNTYLSPKQSYDTCLRKSAFLAERAQTMDRDVREKLRSDRFNDVQRHAFTMIAKTDQMLAVPLWLSEYHRVFQEGVEKNLSPEVIEQQAVDAGDAAVRRVFGSGDVKDLSSVQRGTEVTKALTMFYSYMNTVLNALVFRYGRGIDDKEWGSFAKAIVYWLVLTSVGEALLRSLWGNDDDDILEKIAKSFVGQAFGMFPVARDVFRLSIEVAMGGKVYDAKMTSAFDAVPRTVKAVQSVVSDNKDKIDAGRDITKAANAFTGMSDTLTDALWTFARYADNDFDNDIGEFLKAVVFDKKLR